MHTLWKIFFNFWHVREGDTFPKANFGQNSCVCLVLSPTSTWGFPVGHMRLSKGPGALLENLQNLAGYPAQQGLRESNIKFELNKQVKVEFDS